SASRASSLGTPWSPCGTTIADKYTSVPRPRTTRGWSHVSKVLPSVHLSGVTMSAVRQLVVVIALGTVPLGGLAAQGGQSLAVGSFETDGSVGMDRDAYTAL